MAILHSLTLSFSFSLFTVTGAPSADLMSKYTNAVGTISLCDAFCDVDDVYDV